MTAQHEWTSHAAEYDYTAMAREAKARIAMLEKGLAQLKGQAPPVFFPGSPLYSRILLLEEELMEQRSLYKLFCRKAAERRKP